MKEVTTDWSKKEFKAYLLLYAANANFFESEEEQDLIHDLVKDDVYKDIHRELDKDNDYQRIQKILHNIEKFGYKRDDLDALIQDVQTVFNADGSVDTLEANMLRALKHLL